MNIYSLSSSNRNHYNIVPAKLFRLFHRDRVASPRTAIDMTACICTCRPLSGNPIRATVHTENIN